MHLRKDLRQPLRPVHHIETPSAAQQICRTAQDIHQCTTDLMTRDRICVRRVLFPALHLGIRRIYRHNVRTACPCDLFILTHVPPKDSDRVLTTVQDHAAPRHISGFRLQLNTEIRAPGITALHQDRDHACPGAQINDAVTGRCLRICRKQDRIHAETEPSRMLDDLPAVTLQIVDPLSLTQYFRHSFPARAARPSPRRQQVLPDSETVCVPSCGKPSRSLQPDTP